jgi:hypothetical protein
MCPLNPLTASYYDIHSNVMYASGGLKSDYAGHDKRFHNNLQIGAASVCGQYCWYSAGHEDWCHNNTASRLQAHKHTHCLRSMQT